jgi:hypothetical protein
LEYVTGFSGCQALAWNLLVQSLGDVVCRPSVCWPSVSGVGVLTGGLFDGGFSGEGLLDGVAEGLGRGELLGEGLLLGEGSLGDGDADGVLREGVLDGDGVLGLGVAGVEGPCDGSVELVGFDVPD